MRAFDAIFEIWDFEEKEDNWTVVKDTVGRLLRIFNYLADSDPVDSNTDMERLCKRVKAETGIDPLTLFGGFEDFESLIRRVFLETFNLSRFEKYITVERPSRIEIISAGLPVFTWRQLLDHGLACAEYRMGQRKIQVVPRTGLKLSEIVAWPRDRFIDPGDPFSDTEPVNCDIVAIKRSKPFTVNIGDRFKYEENSYPFYYGGCHEFIWVGRNTLGMPLSTGTIKLKPRSGHRLVAFLKCDTRTPAIRIFVPFVDFYDPEKPYANLRILVNREEELWTDITDASGRKFTEVYRGCAIEPHRSAEAFRVELQCNGDRIGEPIEITLEDHLLFSTYSRTLIQPGRRKFGETRYILFTRAELPSINHSLSISMVDLERKFGPYNVFEVEWTDTGSGFLLQIGDTEWSFQHKEEIFLYSENQFEHPTFQVEPDLIPYVFFRSHNVSFHLETNMEEPQLGLYDVGLSIDGHHMGNEQLLGALKNADKDARGRYVLGKAFLLKLAHHENLGIGKYTLSLMRGRAGSRDMFRQHRDFFILPELKISPEKQIVKECDEFHVEVEADEPCFTGNADEPLDTCLSVSLGQAHLDKEYPVQKAVFLQRPSVSLLFSYQPVIFACRHGSLPITHDINFDSLEQRPIIIHGKPQAEVRILALSHDLRLNLDRSGWIGIPQEYLRKAINGRKTPVSILHEGLVHQFHILWQTRITRLVHSGPKDRIGFINMDEANFELDVDGPPDSQVRLRLLNNIGELCGEKIVRGVRHYEDSVLWSNPVNKTRTLSLKAEVLNADGVFVDEGCPDLLYEFSDPELELRSYMRQIETNPTDPAPLFKAGVLAHEQRLLDRDAVISHLYNSFEKGLTEVTRLEKVAAILSELNAHIQSREVLKKAVRSYGASLKTLVEYMQELLRQSPWDENDDTAFRQYLDRARHYGLVEPLCNFYAGCRALKGNRLEEARDFFFRCWESLEVPRNEILLLLMLTYFKKGYFSDLREFYESHPELSVEPSDTMFYLWAIFASQGRIEESTPLPDKGDSFALAFLTLSEKKALEVMKYLSAGQADCVASCLEEACSCLPGLIIRFTLLKIQGEHEQAKDVYRWIIGKDYRFERILTVP